MQVAGKGHERAREAISNERTFAERTPETAILSGLCERVCSRARRRGVLAGQVTLKLRYHDFDTISRGRTITPTANELELYPIVLGLYRAARTRPPPIRLLGVALAKLRLEGQLSLDRAGERRGDAIDRVRDRFGYDAVHLATTLGRGRPA